MPGERVNDGRRARGNRTRAAVVARAADIASIDGLEGLSMGRLAADLGISKAGVFTHFGSKEALQLATVQAASGRFSAEVIEPAGSAPEGLPQLWALMEHWINYSRTGVFPGGCFFFQVAAEFDARTGPVHEELAAVRRRWLGFIEGMIERGQELGHLVPEVGATQLAFELDALGMATNLHARLCDDPSVYASTRTAMLARLQSLTVDRKLLPER